MTLIDDIAAFKKLENTRRKWVISQFFDLNSTIYGKFGTQAQKTSDFNIGLQAIDALHHLAKENPLLCGFCGKTSEEVKALIAGPVVHICNECVELFHDVVCAGVLPKNKVEPDSRSVSMTSYEKAFISLRYWMLGRQMHQALAALEFASKFHTGTRKDGITPEYYHQLSIVQFIRTLAPQDSGLLLPEATFAAACLHDVCEDYDVGFSEIETLFGEKISEAVRLLTKKHRGSKMPMETYYSQIGKNSIASIVKGADRINNLGSMVDVFTREKQEAYIEETEKFILPMLKEARRLFSQQEPSYMNIKFMLNSQINMIRAIHRAADRK